MVARDDTTDRYSFKVEFDHYLEGQTCMGLDKLVLNNMQGDNTYMKEYLSYQLMTYMGVSSPLYTFSDIKINGEDWGFYLAIEALEDSFADRNYGSNHGQLYKPEGTNLARGGNANQNNVAIQNQAAVPQQIQGQNNAQIPPNSQAQGGNRQRPNNQQNAQNQDAQLNTNQQPQNAQPFAGGNIMGGSSGGADLVYTDDNTDSYSSIFNNSVFKATNNDYKKVIEAIKNLNHYSDLQTLEKYVDVDNVLRYFAVNTVIVNLDSYASNMKHNYYIYEDSGQISILPWDFNLAFGGFNSKNASTVINFPIDTPVSGTTLEASPLIGKLLEVDEYKERYHQYLQQIVDEYFNGGIYENTINTLDSVISSYVQSDATSFTTYEKYKASIPALLQYGTLRAQSIQGQLDGTIPSTTETQSTQPDKLIDASSFNLSLLGSMGAGGQNDNGVLGAFNNRQNQQENQNNTQEASNQLPQENNPNSPTLNRNTEIQENPNTGLQNGEQNNNQQNLQKNSDANNQLRQGQQQNVRSQTKTISFSFNDYMLITALAITLIGGIMFIILYKRKKY